MSKPSKKRRRHESPWSLFYPDSMPPFEQEKAHFVAEMLKEYPTADVYVRRMMNAKLEKAINPCLDESEVFEKVETS
mgnify:CR=1 FL=1